MKEKINATLLSSVRRADKAFEINDTELRGFGLRVQPTGRMSYFVRYRLRGKQTRFVIGATDRFTPAQARDKARQLLAGVSVGSDPGELRAARVETTSLGDFIEHKYTPWSHAHRKSAASTIARIRANFFEFWDKPISDLTPWAIENWRVKRLGHAKSPARPTTVNRDLNALKAALSRAVEWGMIETHPLAKVRPTKVDTSPVPRYLSTDERTRLTKALDARDARVREKRTHANAWRRQRGYELLQEIPDDAYVDYLRPAILLSLNTGLRQGETLSLIWTDVDLDGGRLTVRGDKAKSGRTRHVPLNAEAVQVLQRWRKSVPSSTPLVFPSPKHGKRIVDVKTAWSALLRDAGIEDFRWHDMRHDFASRLVMAGVDLNTVRELLGHADLKMTLRYAHLAPEHKAAAVAKLVEAAA